MDANVAREIQPLDYISINTGYNFPIASDPAVRQELMDVLRGLWDNDDVMEYVLYTLAMSLYGVKSLEDFYVWCGSGRNGKGLLSRLLEAVFGNYFHTIPSECLTKCSDKKGAPNPNIADSKGKHVVQTQEPEVDDKLQVGVLQELTGQDQIAARVLNKNPITFIPQFTLFVQCNGLPRLSQLDDAIGPRMVVIRFPFKFVDEPTKTHHRKKIGTLKHDLGKDTKKRDELLLILLETFHAKKGVLKKKPEFITDATMTYMDENDPVKDWLAVHYIVGLEPEKKYKLPQKELLERFEEETGMRQGEMTASKFKVLMERNGIQQKRESNVFKAHVWVNGEYIEQQRPAGSYYMYLERKR
jgi:P4 family phage/plasmid primase-like protien